MLSSAHFEHGLPLVAQLDLDAFFGASEAGDGRALLLSLDGIASKRLVRKIAAVSRATVAELLASELDPGVMTGLEAKAAELPFAENFQETLGFFGKLGPSLWVTPSPSTPNATSAEGTQTTVETPGASLSGGV